MQTQKPFDLRDYITGRVKLPPFMHGKRQRPFGFSGKASILNGQTGNITLNIHDDAYFLVEAIQVLSSDQTANQDKATIQLTDTTLSQPWSNVAVDLRDLAGIGSRCKYLSDPNILRPSSTLVAQITNNIGGTAEFYLAIFGRKVYGLSDAEAAILTKRMWFQYVLAVATIAGSTNNVTSNLQLFNESDFMLKRLLSQTMVNSVLAATAGTESAEITGNFRNTTTDENLFDSAVPLRLIFGSLQEHNPVAAQAAWNHATPFELPKPWLIRRNSQVAATLNNLATGATGAFNLTFEGIRMFDAK